MKKVLVSAALVLSVGVHCVPEVFSAEGDAGKERSVVANCAPCHGPQGNVTASTSTPRLAQQVAPYIVKQVRDFKSGARQNPIMSTIAASLTDTSIQDVATYFSMQKIAPGTAGNPSLMEQGRKIYSGGVAETSVPACASCHGADGTGVTPSFPRLAGQHSQYIVAQLQAYKTRIRANDDNKVMRDIAARLDDHQIEAVAEYLASL
jgi:cytochrome c553